MWHHLVGPHGTISLVHEVSCGSDRDDDEIDYVMLMMLPRGSFLQR